MLNIHMLVKLPDVPQVVVEGLLHPRWPHKDLERPLQYPVRVAYGTAEMPMDRWWGLWHGM